MTEEDVHQAYLAYLNFVMQGDKLNAEIACKKWLDMEAQKKGEASGG